MKRFIVEFRDVGRQHLTWRAEVPRPLTTHGLTRAIRERRALLSKDIEFADNGAIYVGGVRKVGEWSVIGSAA